MDKVTEIVLEEVLRRIVNHFIDELVEYSKYLIQVQNLYKLKAIQISGHGVLNMDFVTDDVKNKIHEYHHRFHCLIAAAASFIEADRFKKNGIKTSEIILTGHEKDRALLIVKHRRNLSLSFQTLRAVLKLFFQTNDGIREDINTAVEPSEEYFERLKNAVLSYELLDFTYKYISTYELFGKDKLKVIRENLKKELDERENEDIELENELLSEEYKDFSERKKNILNKRINDRRLIRNYTNEAWEEFENKILGTEEKVGLIKKILREIKVFRKDAKNHIGSLYLTPLVSVIQEDLEIADELKDIDWNIIDDYTLEDLLRLSGKKYKIEDKK